MRNNETKSDNSVSLPTQQIKLGKKRLEEIHDRKARGIYHGFVWADDVTDLLSHISALDQELQGVRHDWDAIYAMMREHGWYASREDDVALPDDVKAHINEIARNGDKAQEELQAVTRERDDLRKELDGLRGMREVFKHLAEAGVLT